MRHQFLAVLATTPLIASGAASAGPVAAEHYAALGDSFSSGSGAGDYDPDSGLCRRSANSYPVLWARAQRPDTFEYGACGGAVTDDVVYRQIPDALSDDTTLVTLTIGGDDAGFEAAVVDCVVADGDAGDCERALGDAGRFTEQELPGKLAWTYRAVRAAAAEAEVLVVGYPRLFEPDHTPDCAVAEWRRRGVNQLADRVNAVIREQAGSAGFHYVDVREAFAGHGVCALGGIGREWVTRITPDDAWQSYHPNKRGQSSGYLPAVASAAG
ncbi:SGNH/GDSL hydrolase family protein [Streptosporangium sp. NPDC003464]